MSGRVIRVNGPLVEAVGLARTAMSRMVELGAHHVVGEVVSIDGDRVGVQAYEYTGGLRPGDPVVALDSPLSARLGPGLLGGVFDGLLRPLASGSTWLSVGSTTAYTGGQSFAFVPAAADGDEVQPGSLLGTVALSALQHRVLVPPGLAGRVERVRVAGTCDEDDVVAVVNGQPVALVSDWPVRRPRPCLQRMDRSAPLHTGQRVLDLLFPLARGSTAAVPGGFGTGKTMLLQQVAKWCDADVIVYVGCGERGNEMADVLQDFASLSDPRTGGRLVDRTVIVANTSNMPMMAREASIYTAVTVAEYFRDMGYHAVVIADSTSRWAEALREFASRSGALPAEEGYPASLSSALAAFYERAGCVRNFGGTEGSVTVIGAVSPPGGDVTEPVTAHTQRFARAVWSLDRDLAYARHYPALSWSGSYSRDAASLGNWHARHDAPDWTTSRARVAALLAEADQVAELAALMGAGALAGHERVVLLAGKLLREGLLQQSATSQSDAVCSLSRTHALTVLHLEVIDLCLELVDKGVPPATLEEVDLSALVRAREDGGDDLTPVRDRLLPVLRGLVPS